MARVPILRSSFSWILPAIWIIAAYYIPDVVLWPGRVLVNGIDGQTSALALAILAVLALVVIVVMGWVSRRADMIKASDESVLYARLNQLGTMAWTQRDLRGKIKSEVSLASRGAWLTLPSGNGSLAIAGRAWLAFVRHPMQLVLAVVSGAVFVYSGAWLIVEHSPVQLWLVWLFVLVIVPPRGLVHQYRIDLREAFLRQMLPFSNLRLLMAGAALPGAIVIVTGWLVMAIAPGVIPLSSPDLLPLFAVVAILIVIMETLSLGLDAIKIAGIGVHISQMWTSFFGFGIILLVNMLAGDSTLAILTTVIIALFVAMPLAASYSSQE